MHLKKLIVSGFKSFADKVTLNFNEGITGIVGPNGSGKSNVIDSVRWVMGEQNAKHLRGQVATDIIFAGSHKRKALGMAEVTLVFDNSDSSPFCPPEYRHETEIALSRRLYVDGQREYFINKKPCRLKDIVGFFATTGLGGRSYSMIQQGQVDRILNAKPEDVREILEEAAGTMVFKNRRQAAQKKLEATIDNLDRIEDIVTELERQLEALQGQVEKAEKWKGLSDRLKEQELNLFGHNFFHYTGKLQELTLKLEKDTDVEIETSNDIGKLDVRVQELQQALAEADPELDQIREDISILREQIARAEGSISSAMAALESGEKRLIELDESLDSEDQGLDILRQQVERIMTEYDQAQENLQQCRDVIESFRYEVEQVEESALVFENKSEDLSDQIRNLDRLLESNGLRCESIERERTRITGDVGERRARIDQLREDLSQMNSKVSLFEESVSEKQAFLDEGIAEKQALEEQIEEIRRSLDNRRAERESFREQYFDYRARFNSLKALEDQSDSITETLEKVAEHNSELGSISILTDLIQYADGRHDLSQGVRSAFEIWAERAVVKGYEQLQQLAGVMSEHGIGNLPVSLLSLEPVAAPQIPHLEALKPYLACAEGVSGIDRLVDRLYFVRDDIALKSFADDIPPGIIVFTSRGLILSGQSDFVIRAGAQGQGKLSRKAEIEQLGEQITHVEAEIATIDGALEQLQFDQDELKDKIREIEDDIGSRNKDALSLMSDLQSCKQNRDHVLELKEDAERMLEEHLTRDRSLVHELEELGEARISIGQEKEELSAEIESLQEEFEAIGERKEEVRRMQQRHEVDLAKYETKVQALKDSHEQSSAQLMRSEASLTKRKDERVKIETQIEDAEKQKAQSRQEMESYLYRRDELEEELNVRRERSSGILDELKAVEDQLKEARKKQSTLQTDKAKTHGEIERLRTVVKGLLEQAQEKYQINLMDHKIDYQADFDAESVQKEVQSLRAQIEALGGINMVAIDEYKRLKERYEFIQSQKEEVSGSILLLEEAISEIEDTSREKFAAIFETVNHNFTELFPILFPGGEAKLQLVEGEDILNAGVEIMVRMPGKTPRSMTLYSGGEKALTAISLIFALLKTKPTPFCFLDEVDAPLDEANVGRYNKVLEALSDRFQFIVITHNRRTMEVLDQLYGVTMQEGGVSTVVGVDMQKDLPAHLRKAFKQEGNRAVEGASAN
ncbi:chromosome segregation protein SMC [Pseudobacteriovorax antillogorgiicola]|uniref:Chromosome partition protein Smc n=1 Tax=Pseudobacteriovorax antillogorgiicola TaxID=1513793 RepID=A0A1Y6CIF6_9BACT|nr:chromosome segregation protein SMC [Pseudobacteriovorax antillogorgiicola]TCS46673.1 condensin subunit Smc [Pseudobacteriovorax antillogorgiicola]SMF66647.1 condensin subunit Smc [Pseudobacteriovorax antillogorgiicola]